MQSRGKRDPPVVRPPFGAVVLRMHAAHDDGGRAVALDEDVGRPLGFPAEDRLGADGRDRKVVDVVIRMEVSGELVGTGRCQLIETVVLFLPQIGADLVGGITEPELVARESEPVEVVLVGILFRGAAVDVRLGKLHEIRRVDVPACHGQYRRAVVRCRQSENGVDPVLMAALEQRMELVGRRHRFLPFIAFDEQV